MNTLYINYTINGNPISDYMVEKEILLHAAVCENYHESHFNVSTENVIVAARAMKLTGRITCDLKIMFEGKELDLNEHCNIAEGYPKGFCDYGDGWAFEIVKEQTRRYKERITNAE